MRRHGRTLRMLLAGALAGGLGLSATAGAEEEPGDRPPVIYKWVDEEGIAHFTADPERVPENVRSLIRKRAERERERAEEDAAGAESGAAARDRAEQWAETDAPEEPLPSAEAPGTEAAPGSGPGTRAPRTSAALRAQRAELEQRIAELEARIARDEEQIKQMLSRPPEEPAGEGGGEAAPVASPELREVAMRLPRLQAELRELRERRAQLEAR